MRSARFVLGRRYYFDSLAKPITSTVLTACFQCFLWTQTAQACALRSFAVSVAPRRPNRAWTLVEPGEAGGLLDGMLTSDICLQKERLRRFVAKKQYAEAIAVCYHIQRCGAELDEVVISLALKALSELRDLSSGKQLHSQSLKLGNADPVVLNGLMTLYAKCSRLDCSRRIFDEMPQRSVVCWTSMVNGYIQNGLNEEGIVLFNNMRMQGCQCNAFTMSSLLMACANLGASHQGKWVHGCVIKNGTANDTFLVTGLVDMYVKCGMIFDARCAFAELNPKELVPSTAMIVGYTQGGFPCEALQLFANVIFEGIIPNGVTISASLSACAHIADLDWGRSVHLMALKLGLDEQAVVANALVDMYTKCCVVQSAFCIFKRILHKDMVSWNAMISGYAQNGFALDALKLFQHMRFSGFPPDAITMVGVLSASSSAGALDLGRSLHAHLIKSGFLSNSHVGTALLNLYTTCGEARSGRGVFEEMGNKTPETWSAMMGGYGMQGNTGISLSLFSKMLKQNVQPNHVAFINLISSCSHAGTADEAHLFFDSMEKDFGISPSMKHYSCMVDVLARAGKLEEALEFIERMPIKADIQVWGAFIHGCGLYSRFEIGEMAARRLMELNPQCGSYYVLISNLYASVGKFSEAVQIRSLMKKRKLQKTAGNSIMEM